MGTMMGTSGTDNAALDRPEGQVCIWQLNVTTSCPIFFAQIYPLILLLSLRRHLLHCNRMGRGREEARLCWQKNLIKQIYFFFLQHPKCCIYLAACESNQKGQDGILQLGISLGELHTGTIFIELPGKGPWQWHLASPIFEHTLSRSIFGDRWHSWTLLWEGGSTRTSPFLSKGNLFEGEKESQDSGVIILQHHHIFPTIANAK